MTIERKVQGNNTYQRPERKATMTQTASKASVWVMVGGGKTVR